METPSPDNSIITTATTTDQHNQPLPLTTNDQPTREPFREQDIYLPIANIAKILKQSTPTNGKVAKEAKVCMQEAVSEFISFITSEAAESCSKDKRKTVTGEDIITAFKKLGFDDFCEPLKDYLRIYRENQAIAREGVKTQEVIVIEDAE